MTAPRPITQAKTTAVTLLRETRAAGWLRAKIEIKPDGTISLDAGMTDTPGGDDFLSGDLRMGK